MFGIVSTVSAIENTIRINPRWRRIIEETDHLYIYRDKDIEDNVLTMFSQAGKLIFDAEIKHFPSRSLIEKYSGCVFIFADINRVKAEEIQNKYGVLCQSVGDLDDSILTQIDPDHFELLKTEKGYGWKRICEGLLNPRIPSNCIIVNDRNIFANDHPKDNRTPGLDNLEKILDCLLPSSLSQGMDEKDVIPYHILINCELATLKEDYKLFATRLNKIKKKIGRSYPIIIEFLALTRNDEFFSETHNRRIYSNYFTISCDHMLAAFAGSTSRCSQSLDILKHFSKIEKIKSDQPVKGYDSFMNRMADSIKRWKQYDNTSSYVFSQNGDCRPVIHRISNRLVIEQD